MAKDKTETPEERAARKAAKAAKKEAKATVEANGVKKSKSSKSDKKSSSKSKDKTKTDALEKEARKNSTSSNSGAEKKEKVKKVPERKSRPAGPLVAFADPLADEKTIKKLLKSVERAGKQKCLKRGVKEVNKAIKNTPMQFADPPEAICIVAGDISPMDVITHIPVYCEKHFIPYVFVPSRDKLGQAGLTARPTSVVLVCRETKQMVQTEKEDWAEEFKALVKTVEKVPRRVPIA